MRIFIKPKKKPEINATYDCLHVTSIRPSVCFTYKKKARQLPWKVTINHWPNYKNLTLIETISVSDNSIPIILFNVNVYLLYVSASIAHVFIFPSFFLPKFYFLIQHNLTGEINLITLTFDIRIRIRTSLILSSVRTFLTLDNIYLAIC